MAGSAAADPVDVERGRYLASIMACSNCHTDGAFIGKPDMEHPLAGSSIGHQVAGLGTFWPPNLTPDPQTGLGAWSLDDIVAALREGRRPDGRILAPAMPWRAYSNLSVTDARAIAAYLKSLPPMNSTVRPPLGEHEAPTTTVVMVVPPK
jgi:cytochrome c553